MKSSLIYFALFGLIMFSSCDLYMKIKYKTGRIQNESIAEQTKYLIKNGIDTTNCFQFNQAAVNTFWESAAFPLLTSDTVGVNPIQIRTFDSLGDSKYNWTICYGDLSYFLADCSLYNEFVTNIDTSLSFPALACMTDDSAMFKRLLNPKKDLFIVSIWAKYLGTPCIESMKTIQNFVDTSSCNMQHIKIHLGRWDD